jgi:hypothetical protein
VRAKTVAAVALVALVVIAYLYKADVAVQCRYSAERDGQCAFTNPSVFPVLGVCGRLVLTAKYPSSHEPSKSEPVCSGFLWPRSTTKVRFSDMDPDPFRACDGSLEHCYMKIVWE